LLRYPGNPKMRCGQVTFRHAKFRTVSWRRTAYVPRGKLINPDGTALDGDGIHVTGDVSLRTGFHAEGAVRLI
jgi:hypothetical protein